MINNHQTFAGLQRKECLSNDWQDSHDSNNIIEYDKDNKMLQIRFKSYVWNREGDTLVFYWSLFYSDAEDFCFEKVLKKLLKMFDL